MDTLWQDSPLIKTCPISHLSWEKPQYRLVKILSFLSPESVEIFSNNRAIILSSVT